MSGGVAAAGQWKRATPGDCFTTISVVTLGFFSVRFGQPVRPPPHRRPAGEVESAAARSFSVVPRRPDAILLLLYDFPFGIVVTTRRACSSACVRACSHDQRPSERDAETRRRHERAPWTDGRDGTRVGRRLARACAVATARPSVSLAAAARARGPCECVRQRCHARHALGRNAGPAPPRALKFGTGPGSQPWRPSAAAAPPSAAVGTAKEVREVNSPGRLRSDFVPRPH